MTFTPEIAVVVGLLFLIGGPIYLIGKALERRRARKAEAWRLSTPGFQHHAAIASARVDSLGPLTLAEHEALLFNLLWVSSHQGAVTWEGIIAQTGVARQMVRDHLNSLATEPDDVDMTVAQDDDASAP